MIVALLFLVAAVPAVTSTAAVVTGNQQEFCETVLEGKYTPTETNICPGGQWSNVFDIIKANHAKPTPTK